MKSEIIAHKAKLDQNTKLLSEMVSIYTRELLAEKSFSESMLTSLVLNYQVMMINTLDIFDVETVYDHNDDEDDGDSTNNGVCR